MALPTSASMPCKRSRRISAVQDRERRAILQSEEGVGLPATKKVPDHSSLIAIERELVNHVARQTMRPIVT